MTSSQYTIMLTDTARMVYCEMIQAARAENGSGVELRLLDEALDNLPVTAKNRKHQLAGKFSAIYRQKTANHCFTYQLDEETKIIIVIEISPLVDGGAKARELFERITKNPEHSAARAVLGIPEKESVTTPAVN